LKYWIYKDARILGPFERDAMSGLPGFDASTLVCAGEDAGAAEGQWSPAADIPDLAPLTLAHGPTWSPDAPTSSFGLLDKLQIDSAGLIGDDQYPSAAEVLFQDAEIKKSFAELLVARTRGDDTEVRRLRGLVSELSVQLELMYRRIAQLENTHTDFLHRLATTEAAPHSAPAPAPAAAALRPTPPAPPIAAAVPQPAAPFAAAPSAAAPVAPAAPAPATPSAPAAAEPIETFPTEWPEPVAAPGQFPTFADFKPAAPAPVHEIAAPIPAEPAPAPVPAAPATAFEFLPPPEPAAGVPAGAFETPAAPPLPPLPDLSALAAAAVEAPVPPLPSMTPEAPSAPAPEPTPAPTAARKLAFDKPKTLRIVPTVRSFRVVDPNAPDAPASAPEAAPGQESAPAAAALPPMPSLTPSVPAPEASAPPPEAAPNLIPPPSFAAPEPAAPSFAAPAPAPAPSSEPSFNPIPAPAAAAPTFAPEPAFRSPAFPPTGSLPVAGVPATHAPPVTAVFSGGPSFGDDNPPPAILPATQEVLARLAKPAAPPVSAPARPPRSNKKFLVVGGILAVVTIMVLVLFLRRTRASDLNHMASLDDGKPQLGAEPVDDGTRPPAMKPPMAPAPAAPAASAAPAAPVAPATSAAPAAPAGPGAQASFPPVSDAAPAAAGSAAAPAPAAPAAPSPLDAATAFVKNFPLDGRRGTVSKWLDFSYMATPDAGQAVWTPTAQSDGTYLVEYHFVPAVHGAPEILYLFEADPDRGYVLGKNRDAQELLAGGAPRLTVKTASKPKPQRRAAARRRTAAPAAAADDGSPRAVPQLPLPSEGELHAPSEDDGDFGSDTVKSDQ
jgi:hypothetical protein